MKATAGTLQGIPLRQPDSFREWGNLLLDLGKIKISLLATLSAATGYLLATGRIEPQMLAPTSAVFLLACGSCALNQYQEREIDRWMERTKSRPIPSGRLSPETALRISLGLILSGALILLCGAGDLPLALGLFAVLWYNLIYTPLKQKTAFAAVPGALVGAIPPVLGWVAGQGEILHSGIGGVAVFFFVWQIPHFWLLLLDFPGDYERARLPSLTRIFSKQQIRRILFVWLFSVGVSSLAVSLFGIVNSVVFRLLLVAAASWFFWNIAFFLRSGDDQRSIRTAFTKLNIYAVLFISFLILDRLLG